MLLKLESGQEYHVRFSHVRQYAEGPYYRTEARLTFADGSGHAEWYGAAFCNPSDQYDKARGRKLSLARAIESLPRAERRQIWAAYFAAIGGVR